MDEGAFILVGPVSACEGGRDVGEAGPEALEGEATTPHVDISDRALACFPERGEDLSKTGDGALAEGQDASFVVVGDGLANTREVDDDGNGEFLEMSGGTDAGEQEQLGRVEGAAADDDLFGGVGFPGCAFVGGVVARVRAVETLALKVFNANSLGLFATLVEDDFGGEGI